MSKRSIMKIIDRKFVGSVKIRVPFNLPKVEITFGKLLQVKHDTLFFIISLISIPKHSSNPQLKNQHLPVQYTT